MVRTRHTSLSTRECPQLSFETRSPVFEASSRPYPPEYIASCHFRRLIVRQSLLQTRNKPPRYFSIYYYYCCVWHPSQCARYHRQGLGYVGPSSCIQFRKYVVGHLPHLIDGEGAPSAKPNHGCVQETQFFFCALLMFRISTTT